MSKAPFYPYTLDARWPVEEVSGSRDPSSAAIRFGWWGIITQGSQVKTGEYQDLASSPFWDIDFLRTDGNRTIDLSATGLDNEANQAALRIYGPLGRVKVDFERWWRALDHFPLAYASDVSSINPDLFVTKGIISNRPVTKNPTPVLFQDLNVGEDYAIRVEELKADVSTNLTDDIKFRVKTFQLRKFGERQAIAYARCFHPPEFGTTGPLKNIRACHVLSQRQAIDWTTTEVSPGLEGRWGPLSIDYTHQMRFFGQGDQMVTRLENGTSTGLIKGDFPYAVVPESTTHIDQLRLGLDVAERTRLYAFGYAGNTVNDTRDVRRDYLGYDVRLTDRTFKGLMLTAYTKGYHQNGTRPTSFLPEEEKGVTETGPNGKTILVSGDDAIRNPIEYHRTTAGVKSRWQPCLGGDGLLGRTAFIGGYEYMLLNRDNAGFETVFLQDRSTKLGILEFNQPDTVSHQFFAGIQQPWTDWLDTEVRYKVFFISDPLHGFREISGYVNTNQPDQKHVLEFVESCRPLPNVGFLCQQDIDLRRNNGQGPIIPENHINFNEQSYSFFNSLWYAPTKNLALSGYASWQSNWINQIINLGDEYVDPTQPPPPPGAHVLTDSQRWYYGGRSVVLGSRVDYRLTETVRLHGGYEWVRGDDRISTRNLELIGAGRPDAQPWTDLPEYSQVLVITQRISAGVDWKPREMLNVYFRYILFDYEDKPFPFNSGTAHMFLAGGSYVW